MPSEQAAVINTLMRQFRNDLLQRDTLPSLSEMRAAVDSLGDFGVEPTHVVTSAVQVGNSDSLIHEPEGGPTNETVILYCHGGGLSMGSPRAWSRFLGRLSAESGSKILNLGFRLAPEHPYPAGNDDAAEAIDWLTGTGVEERQIVVGGDSAGGALALGTALAMRDVGRNLKGCFVLSPWVDLRLVSSTVDDNAESDVVVSRASLELSRSWYLGDRNPGDPRVSPGLADLAGLPPLHIQASNDEVLVGDARTLHDRVVAAGGDVQLHLWDGVPHVHQLFAGALPEADDSIALAAMWIRALPTAQSS